MDETLISEVKSIADFSDADIELFIDALEEKFLAKGEYFLREGSVSQHLGYIQRGLTMHYKIHEGAEIPADFSMRNTWIAYLKSFSSGIESDMNIKALEDTQLLTLSREKLQQLFQKNPKFLAIQNYYTQLSFIRGTEHATDLASLSAKQRYYKLMKEKPDLINRVPQYYIAAYLGIKPQSLSRLRKES